MGFFDAGHGTIEEKYLTGQMARKQYETIQDILDLDLEAMQGDEE